MAYVNSRFIREALWDRFETIREWGWVDESEEDLFDQFVESVCEGWTGEDDTPKSLVDNWAVNGYTGDYSEFISFYIKDDELEEKCEKWELTDEELNMIEDRMWNEWAVYDRGRMLYHI